MSRTIVYISDLRDQPLCAALSIFSDLRNNKKSVELWIADCKSSGEFDYGDHQISERSRKVRFSLLKLLGVKVIPVNLNTLNNNLLSDINGINSSLVALTNDHLATPTKYPKLYSLLHRQHVGACSAVSLIEASPDIDSIYIFNGRTSSTYAIASYFTQKSLNLHFYEYSNCKYQYFLSDYSPHNFAKISRNLLKSYKGSFEPLSVRVQRASKYISNKLNNPFSEAYSSKPLHIRYHATIFLSSPHEYCSLDHLITGATIIPLDKILEYTLKLTTMSNYPLIAIRSHPNMANDPSLSNWNELIDSLSNLANIYHYTCNSDVSSYDLIKSSDYVVTDISSISLDAFFMGYSDRIRILGHPFFLDCLNYISTKFHDNMVQKYELAYACSKFRLMSLRSYNMSFLILLKFFSFIGY